ncbi:MAG: sulfite exporter TauE/SafE family protein [Polyangiales bacterium]
MWPLALLFLLTAALYASVGLGGGSTYNALLVLAEADYRVLPSIALLCNLVVVSGGVYQYRRAGQLDLRFALPYVVPSIPMAWLGGRTPIERDAFILLLGISLAVAALAMLFQPKKRELSSPRSTAAHWFVGLPVGGTIGFVAGMVGIGGGIFLAPCLHLLRVADAKRVAATASLFIMVNSIAGLVGQTMKQGTLTHLAQHANYLWLAVVVLVGGQIGSRLSSRVLTGSAVRRLTGLLVLVVAGRLLYLWYVTRAGG